MPRFIKIKDATGEGEQVLRTKLILRVYDGGNGGSIISYGNGRDYEVFNTASTAAEVLEAMEGEGEGLRIARPAYFVGNHAIDIGKIDTSSAVSVGGSPISLDDYKRLMGVETFLPFLGLEQEINSASPVGATKDFACTCVHFSGEQDDCPAHGIGTACNDIENVATICPRLRRELMERTGENWSVALMPASIAIAFDGQWQFQCFQGGSRFRYDSKKHLLSFWNNMSGHELEKWIEETIREIIADWRMLAEY